MDFKQLFVSLGYSEDDYKFTKENDYDIYLNGTKHIISIYYTDDDEGYEILTALKVDNNGKVKVTMKHNGGFILKKITDN